MRQLLNQFGQQSIPCFFVIDFTKQNSYVCALNQLPADILWSMDTEYYPVKTPYAIQLKKKPIAFETYQKAFNQVIAELYEGNTYLLNLTFPTKIYTNASLVDIFYATQAKFKLYFQDRFICFSPERFIQIQNNVIKTFPMKGTINALLPNAKQQILNNAKEMAEHVMVVDLLRNDLSMVAKQVQVQRFRYIDKIRAGQRPLLQVSSEITGQLPTNWQQHLGDLLYTLLPAGSISGTPKHNTLNIINRVEIYQRGFFTGIFGYFDGKNVDSAVMIRFIEKQGNELIYKSGGGITIDSNAKTEYQELLDKVYLPI